MERENTEQDSSALPEPLTRRNAAGHLYQRLAIVDGQIREALSLGCAELRRRLEVSDEASPAFLKEESLVYLIRHYHKAGNQRRVNGLSKCLLTRCATLIDSKLGSLRVDLREDGNSSVVAELFARILDLASDRGDFLQVRFWVVLERLSVDVFNKQVNQLKVESHCDYDQDAIDALTQKRAVVAPISSETRSVEAQVIGKSLIRAALSQLEEPFRSAYLLRHYCGWPIEDQDLTVETISRHFGRTPRTIRNWLAKADESLAKWRGVQL